MTSKFIIIIFGLLFTGCIGDARVKDVKLETVPDDTNSSANMTKTPSNMTFDQLFDDWINIIIKKEKPGKEIIAYKFGIFETQDTPSGYYLYLIGAKQYDPKDDDWAAGFGDFKPKNIYLALPEKQFKNLKWNKVEEKIIVKLKEFIKSDNYKSSFFKNAKAIAAGFDDGDLTRIK